MPVLGTYRHYKGGQYRLIGIARHSEDLSPMAVYQAIGAAPEAGNEAMWVRPLSMWSELVAVDGVMVKRFSLIAEDSPLN